MSSPALKPIRVLIVDDSALTRAVLRQAFASDPFFEVVGTAANAYEARDILVRQKPDLMTLDINMPKLDGHTFLQKMMALMPTPTIIFSSAVGEHDTLGQELLASGAAAVIKKSSMGRHGEAQDPTAEILRVAKRVAAAARVSPPAAALERPVHIPRISSQVVGIGASTGGVSALSQLLPQLTPELPAIVIVQHMPEGFTESFAKRMNCSTKLEVKEATDGEPLLTSHIYVAPGGDRHCEVHRSGGRFVIRLVAGPPEKGHRPSVDCLFQSLANHAGDNALGCILTGMGADGAAGLLAMRQAGACTIAQAKDGCAVWGMPGAAVALGAAQHTIALPDLANHLEKLARGIAKRPSGLPTRMAR